MTKEIGMSHRNVIRKAAVRRPARRVRFEQRPSERQPTLLTNQPPQEQQAEEREYGRFAQEADHLFDTSADWW
jgi:hypothetical protein